MRITQAHISESIEDFPFREIFNLEEYTDRRKPAIFFGCYREEDKELIRNHSSEKVICWGGQDAMDYDWCDEKINNSKHIAVHHKVYDLIKRTGHEVRLINPSNCLNKKSPQILGPKIYAYCPKSAPDYHCRNIIDDLISRGYEIIIGDGSYTQEEWRHAREDFYNQVFIGLCLSYFAGGGGTVVEMGLRGIKVITNVMKTPNSLNFETVEDIVKLIDSERNNIGKINHELVDLVWDSLDHKNEWLHI